MQRISAFWSTRAQRGSTSTISAQDIPNRRHVREDYWPTTLDKETEKAARILHSFCSMSAWTLFDPIPPAPPCISLGLKIELSLTNSTAEGYIAHHDDAPGSPRSSVSSASLQTKKKIPPRIVQNAVGLAVFSCMRSGLWKSGSGGSGILVARKSDGRWSPPSGLLLHTAALGFVIGVDMYDCVLVINSIADLETFTRASTTLGTSVELAVGPVMSAGHLENEPRQELGNTVLTYVKARGEHRAVNIDGSLVTERVAENHRFYGRSASVLDILAGQVPHLESPELRVLYEVIKSAEGRVDFDAPLLEKLALQPAPGDALIENPSTTLSPLSPGLTPFGLPSIEDPDPFGVKALEMAGLEIREAGTNERPASSQFEYHPSPTSPMFGQFNKRQSSDTYVTQSNSNRASYMSTRSNRTTLSRMTDAFTQTTTETRGTTPTSEDGQDRGSVDRLPVVIEPVEVDYTKVDESAVKRWSQKRQDHQWNVVDSGAQAAEDELTRKTVTTGTVADLKNGPKEEPAMQLVDERDEDADDEDDDDSEGEIDADIVAEDEVEIENEDEDDEDPVVYEVYEAKAIQPARAAMVSSQVTQITHAKGALVNIPKRVAPPVPPRSPARTSRIEFDEVPPKSPLRNSIQSTRSRLSRSSADSSEVLSMDGVMESPNAEVTANVKPASPAEHEAEASESEKRQSGESRGETALFTTILERRLSMEDIPKTPSTLQTSGHTSSGDEREPRTPKPEDEVIAAPVDNAVMSGKIPRIEARRSLVLASS